MNPHFQNILGLFVFQMLSKDAFGWLPEPSWARGREEGVAQNDYRFSESNLKRHDPGDVPWNPVCKNRFRESIFISAERHPPSARPGSHPDASSLSISKENPNLFRGLDFHDSPFQNIFGLFSFRMLARMQVGWLPEPSDPPPC